MKIVYIYADNPQEFNTSNWRCVIPSQGLERNGHKSAHFHVNEFAQNDKEVEEWCASSDVIVVERNFFGDVLVRAMYWKVRDKIIVCNFDDAYNLMTPDNAAYKFWHFAKGESVNEKGERQEVTFKPDPLTQFKWGLRMAAGAMLPSKILMDDWKEYVNTFYMPNYLDIDSYNIEKSVHKGLIIGWGGSLSHLNSFSSNGILRALKKVCKNHPEIRIMITGDRRVFEKIDLPEDRIIYQNYVPFSHWPIVMSNFDIGIAPLNGEYDRRRSWIKPLEYLAMKIPCVATDNGAYDELKDHITLVKNDYYEWLHALEDMISNIEKYREKAEEGYKFAVLQSIDNNIEYVVKTYAQAIKNGYRE